jgi:hypothetical protein
MSKAMRFSVCAAVCSMLWGCGGDAQQGVVSPVLGGPSEAYVRALAPSQDGRAIATAPSVAPEVRPIDVPGRYALVEVDGRALPTVVSSEGDVAREYSAGRLTFEPDGTWLFRYDFRDSGPAAAREGSDGIAGIYRIEIREPITVQLVEVDTGDVNVGTLATRQEFRLVLDGRTFRFVKTEQL